MPIHQLGINNAVLYMYKKTYNIVLIQTTLKYKLMQYVVMLVDILALQLHPNRRV